MEKLRITIDELYQIFKQSKRKVSIPYEIGDNAIESGDLYFALHTKKNNRNNKNFLKKCYLSASSYFPFIRNISMSILNKDNHFYSNYGDSYARWCLKKGASYAVIDDIRMKKSNNYLLVENTNKALTKLATIHRKNVDTKFIAITGSCGKTTTKELTNYILSKKYFTEATIENHNSLYFIAQRLLNLKESTDIAVIEMGVNAFGQMNNYCEIVQPNFGLITCIGKAHLRGLNSIEGVLKEKKKLFKYLTSVNGHIFKNINDSRIACLAKNYQNITTFGRTKDANIFGEIISTFPFLKFKWYPPTKLRNEFYVVTTKLYGDYNLDNILAAISVALYFDIPPEIINDAIKEYETIDLRSQVKNYGTNKIIYDCYNANPTSMKAAFNNFAKVNFENKVAIIGDMLELGSSSLQEHRDLISFLKTLNLNLTVFVGKEFIKAKDQNFGIYFSSVKTVRKWFYKQKFKNTVIFLKASRGIAIERIFNH